MRKSAIATLSLLLCGIALADTITLKDGKVIEGKIIAESADMVIIKLADGKMKNVSKNIVARIEKSKKPTNPVPRLPVKTGTPKKRRYCYDCRNTRQQNCDECDGTGRTLKDKCFSCEEGLLQCKVCRGRGTVRCTICASAIRNWRTRNPGLTQPPGSICAACRGQLIARCRTCKGKGGYKCTFCKGTQLLRSREPCPVCKGTKKVACAKCQAWSHPGTAKVGRIEQIRAELVKLKAELAQLRSESITSAEARRELADMSEEDRAAVEALRDRLKGEGGYEVYCSATKAEKDLIDRSMVLRELVKELNFARRRAREEIFK